MARDEPLARVQWMFPGAPHPAFPVVDGDGRVVGMLTVGGAQAVGGADLSTSPLRVADVMEPVGPTVTPWTPGPDLMEALQRAGGRRDVVLDPWGRLTGMVTAEGLTSALQSRRPPRSGRPPVGGRNGTAAGPHRPPPPSP